ncbi:LD-carboxypeptidase [Tepidimonas taiwanensis]|uniref:Murein tetrapeptide carboxypeptidase n=1 Tax=Tepidimonas taiwanensis TaxID=307486 RepID=A0A554X9T2_9BURK|nr:LD-carboxypeptidase [Tepidimonas taiwanensis]MDM7462066.1 LD-carboxypeptidase [Tepidimonas taiwanensis]TSE32536.1 Murein tetrapeptide carboxypeptidase [Tepidimonas taiwanensis]UBQ06470.1 LD-carboxypeptidase [Tepidimonas taiwanensis]
MAHLYVYSPSGAVRDRAAFRRALRRLEAAGHAVEVDPAVLASHQRFAGDDETRLAAIGRAAASGADIALTTRGGYGLTRLLPRLPYDAIAASVERGMAWVGLSDFTAMQMAVLAQRGTLTWAGPALMEDWATDTPDEITMACFDDLAQGVGEGTGWRLPLADLRAYPALAQAWHLHDAVLWGGNLSILAGLVGTPYLPAVVDGVLFLEDVGEHPYRIERLLTQLLLAGVLGRQRAILLGAFNRFTLTPHDRGFRLATVVDWLRAQLPDVPVLTGLPFGHVPTKVILPVGRRIEAVVQEREVLLFWD